MRNVARVRASTRPNGRSMRSMDRVSIPLAGKLKGRARMGAGYNEEEVLTIKLDTI